jgi:hypothetical protein
VVVVLVGGIEAVDVLATEVDELLQMRLEHRPVGGFAGLLPDRLRDRCGACQLGGELRRYTHELVVVAADDAD